MQVFVFCVLNLTATGYLAVEGHNTVAGSIVGTSPVTFGGASLAVLKFQAREQQTIIMNYKLLNLLTTTMYSGIKSCHLTTKWLRCFLTDRYFIYCILYINLIILTS